MPGVVETRFGTVGVHWRSQLQIKVALWVDSPRFRRRKGRRIWQHSHNQLPVSCK
jgi:hypothetical protein